MMTRTNILYSPEQYLDIPRGMNALEEGAITQGSWLDFSPVANTLVQFGREILGIAPSERIMQRIGTARSPVLRPQNAWGWADWGAGLLSDIIQTGLAGADLAAIAPAVGRRVAQALSNEFGVIAPRGVPIKRGENIFSLWGKESPRQVLFERVDRLPELRQNIVRGQGVNRVLYGTELEPGVEQIAARYANNPAHREVAALYERGKIDIPLAEDLFRGSVNVDDSGRSVFDQILDIEVRRRQKAFSEEGWKPYAEESFNVSKLQGKNRKVGEELVDLDTSRGCIGMCPECYAAAGSAQSKKCFMSPQPVRLTGHFMEDPDKIRRIGTSGEPNIDPRLWKEVEPQFKQRIEDPRPFTQEELDRFIDATYDWSYTNEQLKKSGLASPGRFDGKRYIPGGADKTFVITKLQSLRGFDPEVTKNLEVSIDPMIPSHFFRSLRNIEEIKRKYPQVNVMMRIRSIATSSDEINTLQKIAVDFANRHDIPVLETRVRFKNPSTMSMSQVLPEYYWEGGQYKHISYYPSTQPKLGASGVADGYHVRAFELHTESGPVPTSVYIRSREDAFRGMSKNQRAKANAWEVWDGGELIAGGLSIDDAVDLGKQTVQKSNPAGIPSKIRVREFSVGESPLSQFGLRGDLHRQCNTFNIGAGACGECQACRAWLRENEARGIQKELQRR